MFSLAPLSHFTVFEFLIVFEIRRKQRNIVRYLCLAPYREIIAWLGPPGFGPSCASLEDFRSESYNESGPPLSLSGFWGFRILMC